MITEVIAGAVEFDAQGRLQLRETGELKALKAEHRSLWYVVATVDGTSVSYGAVPQVYGEVAHLTHLFQDADLRGSKSTSELASIENVETVIGEVRILFGGFNDLGWPALALLARSYPIYIPLVAIAVPTIFLSVFNIVRRAVARVSDVAQKASEIEARRPDARLPVDGIPKEIAPLVVAFNGALGRLEDEFRKRQRFLIDAAHELRTPIAIMQTRIDGMPEGPERSRLLDDVARLAETAEQLLDFERNDQAADPHEAVDLVELTRMIVADLAPLAIAAGYQIAFQSDIESLERKGSRSALRSAVSNLVRNAIDHGGNQGMITISVSPAGVISVRDEGPGIPAEHQELVFEPFYRVTPRSKGAGLGLSLVKQIVANHRGQVSLKSGSTGTQIAIRL